MQRDNSQTRNRKWPTLAQLPSPAKALALGMAPFLVGDALKIAAAAFIAKALRPVIGVSGYASRDT